GPFSDGHVAGRARSALRREWPLRPKLHGDPRRPHVGDDRGDREWIHPAGAAGEQLVVAVLKRLEASDTCGNRGADPVRLLLDLEPRVLRRLTGGSHDHLREAIHATSLLVLDPRGRVEVLE